MNRENNADYRDVHAKREFFVTCAWNMEEILKQEITEISERENIEISHLNINKGGVYLRTKLLNAFELGLQLRTAGRFLLNIKKIHFIDEKEFYKKIIKTPWNLYLSTKSTFKIETKFELGVDKKLRNSHFMSLKLKDAICDYFRDSAGERPSIDKNNPNVYFKNNIVKSKSTLQSHLFIDVFGYLLSRRGYRSEGHIAPLKEDLAAAICYKMKINASTNFIDCMCGTGTMLIESFLMANKISPQFLNVRNKENLSLTLWPILNQRDSKVELERILSLINEDTQAKLNNLKSHNFFGSDLYPEAVSLARKSIKKAGLSDHIQVEQGDAQKISPSFKEGTLFCNPPYGERMGDVEKLEKLYYNLGENLKKQFQGFNAWVLTSNPDLRKKISLRTSKRIPFNNGPIECRLLKYELY